jgi:hypothetical protein
MSLSMPPLSPSIPPITSEEYSAIGEAIVNVAENVFDWMKENKENISDCLHAVDGAKEGKLGDLFDKGMECIDGIRGEDGVDPPPGEYEW